MKRNIIAILRGIQSAEVEKIVEVILESGINKIEVTLDSPNAFDSIERMCKSFEGLGIFGAGTVLSSEEVKKLEQIGVQMIISPNCNIDVIKTTKDLHLLSYPGVFTPSECFTALKYKADGLKFFPCDVLQPSGFKAITTILPNNVECIAVGGVNIENINTWVKSGATGFGIGSFIYKAHSTLTTVKTNARSVVKAYDAAITLSN